ncbi:MAG: RagB/SusD family nutrient uptake outer membrane protein [Flavobacteriia bacterium]|nr:RagB/SusD family nutrient uptake outer membrane protein [Flavobacteriia bacterium]NCT59671.1 RagB/SusD family nutrient uptake outer membrane protein [Flavobacteriia bacterium]
MLQHIKYLKIKTIAIITLVSLFNVSCDSILDEQPISEIGSQNFWKNNIDAESGVVAIYDAMQTTYSRNHFLWGEFRTDNYKAGSSGASINNLELVRQNITPGNASLRWHSLYSLINRANQAIKYIPTIIGYKKSLLAEAHALRAYAYFDAIRVWGSVPLYTEPTESVVDLLRPRTSGTTILNEVIIPDMLKAAELMDTPSNNFRFSKASILCLQADVYMWTHEFDKAKKAIDDMIKLGDHSLVTTVQAWEDLFYNTPQGPATPDARGKVQKGSELILSINYDLVDDQRSGVFGLFFAGIPSFYVSDTLEAKWVDKFPIDKVGWETKYPGVAPAVTLSTGPVYGDWRYFLSRSGGYDNTLVGTAQVAKFTKLNFNPSLDDTDIVLYRYAGMILLLAEAENQLGNTNRSLQLVNQLRTARKLPQVTLAEFGTSIDERENYILDERQLELLGEGKRWWDLRRTNKAIQILNPIYQITGTASQLTENSLLFPVYFEHLIENPNLLPQNAGY